MSPYLPYSLHQGALASGLESGSPTHLRPETLLCATTDVFIHVSIHSVSHSLVLSVGNTVVKNINLPLPLGGEY